MSITNSLEKMKHISVLNYNENYVCISVAHGKSMRIEPCVNGDPSTTPLTLDEIKYINNSSVFKCGMLEFPEEIEETIYAELRIDTSKVLKLKDIREILINPTKTGLIKLLGITSLSDFDRVRGQFHKLKYEGYKLTLDVADLIEKRTKELLNNQIKSSLQIGDAETPVQSDKRVNELEKQLKEMQEMLAKLTASNQETHASEVQNETEETLEGTKKTPGRSKKTT